MFERNFTKDFDQLIQETEPFAFVRFGDGEHPILEGVPYRAAAEEWRTTGGDVWFRDELFEVLKTSLDRFFIGISPPCCAPQAAAYYRNLLGGASDSMAFATLFQFKNFRRIKSLRKRFQDALIVGSGKADVLVPRDGVTTKWDVDAVVDAMLKSERPILVAAGPCANIIIHRYWRRQDPERRQIVIDVGAAFDLEIHEQETREYHKRASKLHTHVCDWNDWKPFGPITEKQKQNAAQRTQAQERYAELAHQDLAQSTVVRRRPEVLRKTGSNVLVDKRPTPKVIGAKKPSRRTRHKSKNMLE